MRKINKNVKIYHILLTFNCLLSTCFAVFPQGAAINTTATPADPSAILDVSSTNSGILIPRLTKLQRSGISQPAEGLMIYQTDDTTGFWYYNGTSWQQIGTASGPAISAGTVIGNTLYWNGTSWVESSNIYNIGGSVGIGTNNPEPTALIDMSSSTKGTLITRMTTAERNAIVNPAEGLQVYNTTTKCFEFYADNEWFKINCAYNFNCGYDNVVFLYNGILNNYGTVKGQNNTCWLNKNLGAVSVATAHNHFDSYGDLFQWGRLADGHQLRSNNNSTTTLSTTDIPGHSNFIKAPSSPYDWRSGQNNSFWQGVTGTNNPCPTGWRLPTDNELNNERTSWTGGNNYTGAFQSNLKLPAAGCRNYSSGMLNYEGSSGGYWSSTVSGKNARNLYFYNSDASIIEYNRAFSFSVRCIKDY